MKKAVTSSFAIFAFSFISNYQMRSQDKIWAEDFLEQEVVSQQTSIGVNDNGHAEDFLGSNGKWTVVNQMTNGVKSNRWYVSESEQFSGAGKCSMGQEDVVSVSANNGLGGNSLHLGLYRTSGKAVSGNIPGSFYTTEPSSETDTKVISPVINLTGKQNVKFAFDYMLGQLDPQAQFVVSYYDGSSWTELPALSNTFSETCPSPRTSMWANSPEFTLPATVNNISNFQIAFRFTSTPDGEGSTPKVSVAIDNIVISGSDIAASGSGASSDLRKANTDEPVTVEDPKKSIQFTVYPNPNSGQFTVDFTGVENNHEVQILLCDTRTGKILYSTTFQSNSIDHNKVDIQPTERVEPGRYICALVCEGIRLNSTVIIH